MANFRVISTNDADAATLTSGDFLASLPVTNLQIEGRARVARTTNVTGNKVVNGNWSAPKVVSALVLYGCNFTSQATLRLELFDGPNQTGTTVFDSGAIPALEALGWGEFGWGLVPWGATVFTGWSSTFSVMWLPQFFAVRSFRITVADAANPVGYIQMKRLLIGSYFEPVVNPDYGLQLNWQSDDQQVRTMASSVRTDIRARYRILNGTLAGLEPGERAIFMEIARTVGLAAELFVSVYPSASGATRRDYSMLCKFTQMPAMTDANVQRHAASFALSEV